MYAFDPQTAFGRNIGVVSEEEQKRILASRVALAGLGGVGGFYALGLARAGMGAFHLADGDRFEMANFNRQAGGTMDSLGRNKAAEMARQIAAIHPHAELAVWRENLCEANIDAFFAHTHLAIDGLDAFSIPAHRLLFRYARARGIPVLLAAPLGLTAALLVFAPDGMPADEYFDWHDGQIDFEQRVNFVLGLAPALLHMNQIDLSCVDLVEGKGPSHGAACLLCASLVVSEALRWLLRRPGRRAAPQYAQMDLVGLKVRSGRLSGGNRNPIQRLKRWLAVRRYNRSRPGARQSRWPMAS